MNNIFDETIRPKALELLLRAKLPEDPIKADNQKNIFLNELSRYRYEDNSVLDANGFEITDRHGWPLTVDQFLKSQFDRYFEVSDLPVTEAECIEKLKAPGITPEERRRMTEQWDKLKAHA